MSFSQWNALPIRFTGNIPPTEAPGSAMGLAFSSISEANQNWNQARDNAMATSNHWGLPNGTHHTPTTTIIKSDSTLRYENPTGSCVGYTSSGQRYTYQQ